MLHLATGIGNQDAVMTGETDLIYFAAVADGVSACRNSKKGADFVVKLVFDVMNTDCEYIFELEEKKAAYILVAYIKKKLIEKAKAENIAPESYSSTISFVCLNKKNGRVMTFILGDSNIYGITNRHAEQLEGSEEFFGKCCSTMTEGAETQAKVRLMDKNDYSGFFISTDGAWKLIFTDEQNKEKYERLLCDEKLTELSAELEKENNSDDCSYAYLKINVF